MKKSLLIMFFAKFSSVITFYIYIFINNYIFDKIMYYINMQKINRQIKKKIKIFSNYFIHFRSSKL